MLSFIIYWILLGSLGTNLLWISWVIQELPFLDSPSDSQSTLSDYYTGLFLGLLFGPFTLIFGIYKLCLLK